MKRQSVAFIATVVLTGLSTSNALAYPINFIPRTQPDNIFYSKTEVSVTNQTNVFVDTKPIQQGLSEIAAAQRESFGPEYLQQIRKRYPEITTLGRQIGFDLDHSAVTEFIRDHGRAAFEKEVEVRLTALKEDYVIAADLARAVRGEEPLTEKTMDARKENAYPFQLPGLLKYVHQLRFHDRYSLPSLDSALDPAAKTKLSGSDQRRLEAFLAASMTDAYLSDRGVMQGVDYESIQTPDGRALLLQNAARLHSSILNPFGINGSTTAKFWACKEYLDANGDGMSVGYESEAFTPECRKRAAEVSGVVAKLQKPAGTAVAGRVQFGPSPVQPAGADPQASLAKKKGLPGTEVRTPATATGIVSAGK